MKKNTISAGTVVALGASAVALATGAYYFFGKGGEAHRKKLAGWMIKMKGEIIEKIEDAGEVSEKVYHEIVDSVLASYAANKKIASPELEKFARELKSQWKDIVKSIPKHVEKIVKTAKEENPAKKTRKA